MIDLKAIAQAAAEEIAGYPRGPYIHSMWISRLEIIILRHLAPVEAEIERIEKALRVEALFNSAERARSWKAESERDRLNESLKRADMCDVCAGIGKVNDAICICNGTGSMSMAVVEIRKLLHATQKERDDLKRQLSSSNHPENYCQRCGRPNICWFAPNVVWNAVNPTEGILCPVCFVQTAESQGIQGSWKLHPEDLDLPRAAR
jgi:hypothetical protein